MRYQLKNKKEKKKDQGLFGVTFFPKQSNSWGKGLGVGGLGRWGGGGGGGGGMVNGIYSVECAGQLHQ